MKTVDDKTAAQSDDPIEQLLAKAEARVRPPPEVAALAHEAVKSEWQKTIRHRSHRRLALAASVLLAAALWFSFGNQPPIPSPAIVASVDKVVGEFSYLQDDGLLERHDNQEVLHAGETIVTDSESQVGVLWHSGGSLRLDVNTSIRLLQSDQIELLSGRVYFDSDSSLSHSLPLTIRTAYGDVQHLGTQFMTDVRTEEILKVSVREGRVSVDGLYHQSMVDNGEQVVFQHDRAPLVTNLSSHSAEWQWIQAIAPAASMKGKTFLELLVWVCRETGLSYEFASPGAEAAASAALAGVTGADPMAMLRVGAGTISLEVEQINGVIHVSERRP